MPGALPSSTIIDEVRPRRASRNDHDRRNGTPAASSSRRRSAEAASVASRATWSAAQAAEVTKFASVTWQLPQNSG
jgi:hypothetical protein